MSTDLRISCISHFSLICCEKVMNDKQKFDPSSKTYHTHELGQLPSMEAVIPHQHFLHTAASTFKCEVSLNAGAQASTEKTMCVERFIILVLFENVIIGISYLKNTSLCFTRSFVIKMCVNTKSKAQKRIKRFFIFSSELKTVMYKPSILFEF